MSSFDSYFDTFDQYGAFGMLAKGRMAPARGRGLNTRDARAGAAVQELLASQAPLELDRSDLVVRVKSRLGEGRFGDVLLGETAGGEPVAVKVALRPTAQLAREASVLRAMHGQPGFPALVHYQPPRGAHGLELLVMALLGPSLQAFWQTTTRSTQFSAPTVLRVGRGALRALRRLHAAGYVHNDLKPANLLLGAGSGAGGDGDGDSGGEVHLIDFGLATLTCPEDEQAEAQAQAASEGGEAEAAAGQVGTPMFASIAAHDARPTRAADDLESLVYVLAFLASGGLPWQHKPHPRAAFMKRRMVTDGCEVMTDSCAAEALTEGVRADEAADALQAVWAEVVACHEAPGNKAVDYDACLAALGASADEGGAPHP